MLRVLYYYHFYSSLNVSDILLTALGKQQIYIVSKYRSAYLVTGGNVSREDCTLCLCHLDSLTNPAYSG